MNGPDASDAERRRATIYLAGICVFGGALCSVVLWVKGYPTRPWEVAATVSGAVLVCATLGRKLPATAMQALFALPVLFANQAVWLNNAAMSRTGRPFTAFSGQKVAVVMVAILAPSLGLGVALVGLTTALPLIQWLAWSPESRALLPPFEPWQTVTIGLTALALCYSRQRQRIVRKEAAQAMADRAWSERAARLSRFVRHLANTPLQTLTLTTELLRLELDSAGPSLGHMQGAITQLRQLDQKLAPLAAAGDWPQEGLSFDAVGAIHDEMSQHLSHRAAELEPRSEARGGLVYMSWACAMGGLISVATAEWRGYPRRTWMLATGLGLAGLGVTLALPRLARWVSLLLILLQSLAVLLASWLSSELQAASGGYFVPFNPNRVLALVVAMSAPSGWLGAAILGLSMLGPIVQPLRWPAGTNARMPNLEPFMTATILAVAAAVLWARRRHAALARAVARTRAQRDWLERFVQLSLLVRELTDVPLQTLRRNAAAMRQQHPTAAVLLDRVDHAAVRIEQLKGTLERIHQLVEERPGERSLDDLARIEREVGSQ